MHLSMACIVAKLMHLMMGGGEGASPLPVFAEGQEGGTWLLKRPCPHLFDGWIAMATFTGHSPSSKVVLSHV